MDRGGGWRCPPRSLDVLPNNLPAQLTSFVGRIDELVEVQKLLDERRLLTLAGAGGCGKTRLAVQSAAELVDRWPDGVWWVDLGFMSRATVKTHLAHIYAKLDITNRTELATLASTRRASGDPRR